MNKPHKIYKSLDLRNNKLYNTKTVTPEHAEHVVNKEYVDTSIIYDTDKVTQLVNPIKLDWVKNPKGKKIKELLDDVFFPLLLPNYEDPNFINVQAKIDTNKIIFYETSTTFTLNWLFEYNDRLPTTPASIIIKQNDVTTNVNLDSNGIDSSIEFSSLVNGNLQSMVISRTFAATTITKDDSYGNPYKPTEMTVPKNITYDLVKHLTENGFIFSNPILYCPQNTNISDKTQTTDFSRTNKKINVFGGITNDNKIYLLIPEEIKDYRCYLDDNYINLTELFGEPTKKVIKSTKGDDNNYLVYNVDLGYYNSFQTLNIEFIRL